MGITGTIGSGKGTIVERLKEKHGFVHFSVRQFLKERIRTENLPMNRDSMRTIANGLRETRSADYIVDRLMKDAYESGHERCIVESIRTMGEVRCLRNRKHVQTWLIAADADPRTRYDRVVRRGSETDDVSFEKFVEDEAREWSSTNETMQNLQGCVQEADRVFMNDSSVHDLNENVDAFVRNLLRSDGE